MKKIFSLVHIFFLLAFLTTGKNIYAKQNTSPTPTYVVDKIVEIHIDSSINPATLDYVEAAHKRVSKEGADALLIKLNTPGGLVSTTKDIIELIGGADFPTIVWVTPEGASATSAGAILGSSAHLLYMNEGTNIGAATPVQMGKEIPEDMKKKAVNDLVALVKSLAEARGRGAEPFAKMVSNAESYEAGEALKLNLINGIVHSNKELAKVMDGATLNIKGKKVQLESPDPLFITHAMNMGQKLLDIFANPSMAYILFLIGAALLYLELQAPGGMIAGSIGAVCLILAGIGFQVLPLNFGALGLVILSFVLFVLEAFITSYGILSLAGLASLITGSLFLYRTEDSYLTVSLSLIISATSAIALFLAFVAFYLTKNWKNRKQTHFNQVLGSEAKIIECPEKADPHEEYHYKVKINGEIWKAKSKQKYEEGDLAEVKRVPEESLEIEI